MKVGLSLLVLISLTVIAPFSLKAQDTQGELAATLEVLSSGVEVLRVNTVNWISVKVEAIVGVGDTIRTGPTGRARITFFADGTDTELLSNTEYRIIRFEGGEQSFNLSVEIVAGQTTQRLSRLLDADSSYDVRTPGMTLAARGTRFAIRVNESGQSAMLVSEGNVNASQQSASAEVPSGYGIRATVTDGLSDVVKASNFEQLDTALDGCAVTLKTPDDIRLNVRTGPGLNFPRAGTVDPAEISRFIGTIEAGNWYRIEFRGGYGWVLSSFAKLQENCAGLRVFPDDFGPEDVSRYTSVGDLISLEDLTGSSDTAPEATGTP